MDRKLPAKNHKVVFFDSRPCSWKETIAKKEIKEYLSGN